MTGRSAPSAKPASRISNGHGGAHVQAFLSPVQGRMQSAWRRAPLAGAGCLRWSVRCSTERQPRLTDARPRTWLLPRADQDGLEFVLRLAPGKRGINGVFDGVD